MDLKQRIFTGTLDPHTQAFTTKMKLKDFTLQSLYPYKLFHAYTTHNKVLRLQYIKISPIRQHNFDNYQWYDIIDRVQFNTQLHS